MIDNKNPLIIIAGPTAIGKSDLAVKLARMIGGEIISADSMQVYKGMDIGTAKITNDEMLGIRHHLIDILDPSVDFSVADFKVMATKLIEEICDRGNIPIIAGGTGFYIQSVLYDIDFNDSADSNLELRDELSNIASEKGAKYLHDMLRAIDAKSADEIHENNIKRVIRAIEYYKMTGEKISEHNEKESQKVSPYNYCYFVIDDDRDKIYERIDLRVDKMVENGLIEEVKALMEKGYSPDKNISMLGLSYKEIYDYLKGACELSEAIRLIKRDTRHFAKKQLTWFKREKEVIWINRSSEDEMLAIIMDTLKNHNVIV